METSTLVKIDTLSEDELDQLSMDKSLNLKKLKN